jgi:hypothetical protein
VLMSLQRLDIMIIVVVKAVMVSNKPELVLLIGVQSSLHFLVIPTGTMVVIGHATVLVDPASRSHQRYSGVAKSHLPRSSSVWQKRVVLPDGDMPAEGMGERGRIGKG